MADTAYDSDRFRQAIAAKGALAVIPTTHRALSNIRSTSTSMPSAISSSAASPSSSSSAASQPASRRPPGITSPSSLSLPSPMDAIMSTKPKASKARSALHEGFDVGCGRAGEPFEVVAAFEQRDDAAPRSGASAISISFCVAQAKSASVSCRLASGSRQWASKPAEMMIRSGPKPSSARQDHGLERLAECVAAVARPQRRVDDGVVLAALRRPRRCRDRAASGGSSSRARVGSFQKMSWRAVAVVDVEVDDRDALGAVRRLRVAGRDRRVVEEAEAHRRARVSAWWPGGRMATKAFADLARSSPRRPPARRRRRARSAASKVPGDIEVSASMPHHALLRGDASRTCST